MQIHQISYYFSENDQTCGNALLLQGLLKELGFVSDIFCEETSEKYDGYLKPLHQLTVSSDDLLLVHGSRACSELANLSELNCRKIFIYNMAETICNSRNKHELISRSEDVAKWREHCFAAITDTEQGEKELTEAGFEQVAVVPLFDSVEYLKTEKYDSGLAEQLGGTYNLLFVGAFCEENQQLQLVEMVNELPYIKTQPVRLILVGSDVDEAYVSSILRRIRSLRLGNRVTVVTDQNTQQLSILYRNVDAYICLSKTNAGRKGLIEAMANDIVIAAAENSVSKNVLGSAALFFPVGASAPQMASFVYMLLTEPALRRRIISEQRVRLANYSRVQLRNLLEKFFLSLGISVIETQKIDSQQSEASFWQIEGPFDSSYSLAIVNRELALALDQKGHHYIGLRSREGHGDFDASNQFLEGHPLIAVLNARSKTIHHFPDVVLRNCYPPVLDDFQGNVRLVHSYGWEETGFPVRHVNEFNRKLDLITVVSRFVGKTLRDNGVTIPIAVVGNGADHLLKSRVRKLPDSVVNTWRKFRFLHVSSCFPRKGVDALLKAFGQAFRAIDDVSLIIKTFPNPHNEVQSQLSAYQCADKDFPHVQILMDDYGEEQLRGLYAACDALVASSRGEGFGLPVAEAMLLKLPVIVTAWSGVLDFCDNETAWLCGYQFAKSESHLSAIHSAWADPDVEHLAELLREVHHGDMETRSRRVESAFQRITQNFKWSDVADRTELAVDAIKKQHRLRREPKIGWLSTWNARCGIAAYSSFLTTSIPDSRLIILASHIPERTEKDGANVFRCWDASMDETLEHAFDIAIEREIEVMVIQYNFGFYSLETLALLVQKLKQRNIGVHIFFHSTADIDGERGRISLKTVTDVLKQADRLFVHGIDDLNRLKDMGLVDNLVFFPQGLMPTISNAKNKIDARPLSGKKVLAAYGFLLPHKGIQTLIKAFSILAAQNANWHLLLVTSLYPASVSEHEYHICDELIHEHGLAERVTFQTEYLTDEESQAWLQQADLIVYPYQKTQESSSAAVRMGLAAGKPVAVTPLSIFDDVQDAVHVLPGTDVDALVSGISCIANDGSALLAKAQQAELWTQSRQWPVLSHRLINLIDGLANALDLDIGRI